MNLPPVPEPEDFCAVTPNQLRRFEELEEGKDWVLNPQGDPFIRWESYHGNSLWYEMSPLTFYEDASTPFQCSIWVPHGEPKRGGEFWRDLCLNEGIITEEEVPTDLGYRSLLTEGLGEETRYWLEYEWKKTHRTRVIEAYVTEDVESYGNFHIAYTSYSSDAEEFWQEFYLDSREENR